MTQTRRQFGKMVFGTVLAGQAPIFAGGLSPAPPAATTAPATLVRYYHRAMSSAAAGCPNGFGMVFTYGRMLDSLEKQGSDEDRAVLAYYRTTGELGDFPLVPFE